jgi:DNA-binding winged helix-turn-helix (wHTH) protein
MFETFAGYQPAVYVRDFRFEPGSCRLWHADGELKLRPKTAAVLALLVARAGDVVPKRDLLRAVWPEGFVGDNALSVCVNELRQVLGDDPREPRFIATAHRRGYRLVADVSAARHGGSEPAPLFVGRTRELTALGRWWQRARSGQRQVSFIAGEAGVGKTAVIDAFIGGLSADCVPLVGRGQCVEQVGPGEPYLPILEALAGLCRVPGGAGVREVLRRCAPNWLLQLPDLLDDSDLDALQRRAGPAGAQRMLREFAVAAEQLAAERPLLLVLDDLHHADRASVELISYLAQRRETARLLLLGAYRPAEVIARTHVLHQVSRDLAARGQCAELVLEPFSAAEVGSYLSARLAPLVPSRRLDAEVHERTEGNALFVAALSEHLIAGGLLIEEQGTVGTPGGLASLGVPGEVRLMLERRVDALDEQDRDMLVAASAAGVEFVTEAVSAALAGRRTAAEVEERCDRLAREGALLRPAGTAEWPDGTLAARYRFTHEMYREVLYGRLGPTRRALVHRSVGRRLAAGYAERPEEAAAELARHFERGRDYPAAVEQLGVAALTALRRSAYPEVTGHTERGLKLLARVPGGAQRSRLELALRRPEVAAAAATWEWGSQRARESCERLRDLATENSDAPALLAALVGLYNIAIMDGDHAAMQAWAGQVDALALRDGASAVQLVSDLLQLQADSRDGRIADMLERARRMLRSYRPTEHAWMAVLVGDEPDVAAHLYAGLALWFLGYPDQARQQAAQAVAAARAQQIPAGLARALWFAATVHLLCGDVGAVGQLVAELEEVCSQYELRLWRYGSSVLGGWAAATAGEAAAGLERLRHGAAAWSGLTGTADSFHQQLVAELCLAAGDPADGLAAVRSGLVAVDRSGYVRGRPELVRLRGELMLLAGPGHALAAEGAMLRAREMAAQLQARSLELRAATSLARLQHAQGRTRQAATLLGGVYESFTEGHDTRDLIRARTLLAELRGRP